MDAFETELAALIERHARMLTSNQIITGLERALDEALVLAGEAEASKLLCGLLDVVPDLLEHSISHYGHPTDATYGVGLLHAKTQALLLLAVTAQLSLPPEPSDPSGRAPTREDGQARDDQNEPRSGI